MRSSPSHSKFKRAFIPPTADDKDSRLLHLAQTNADLKTRVQQLTQALETSLL